MKPYPAYKDSGIEWAGKIPKEWKNSKIKHVLWALYKSKLEASEGKEEGLYPFFTSSIEQNKFIDFAIFDDECLIMGDGGQSSINYCEGKFSTSSHCLVFKKQKNISLKFIYYQILSNINIINSLGFSGIGLKNIQKDFFYNMNIFYPDLDEQKIITRFLDEKICQIDSIISKKEKIIELLKEERTAVINEAVTKGLNPNAEMKDSEIEWLSDVPENWEVIPLKRLLVEPLMYGANEASDDVV